MEPAADEVAEEGEVAAVTPGEDSAPPESRERSIIRRLLSLKWLAQTTFGHNLSTKVGVCGVNV